jgi:hypothetical protein
VIEGARMTRKNDSCMPGKVVFALTFVAMLVFFWWLLIYDHDVISKH